MSIFSRLFGGAETAGASNGRGLNLAGDGTYSFEIVGEAHYQAQLRALAHGTHDADASAEHECEATLAIDHLNVHDDNAVKIDIGDYTVGYIARALAPECRRSLSRMGLEKATCRAKIVGGWDRGPRGKGQYGVKLDLVWPLRRA